MSDSFRLDKLLAFLGLGTRSQCTKLLHSGQVRVDEQTVRDGSLRVHASAITLCVGGETLSYKRYRHVMLHKPAGVITAQKDKRHQTVMDLLPALYHGCECMPVGRLDIDTTGLLLLTNDGQLAHRILSPKREIDKVYEACVDGPLEKDDVDAFAEGLPLGDFTALPATLEVLESTPSFARALCTVHEGKFHQVKRMFAARGHTVTALLRRSIGPITLDPSLAPGEFRELTPQEESALFDAVHYTASMK